MIHHNWWNSAHSKQVDSCQTHITSHNPPHSWRCRSPAYARERPDCLNSLQMNMARMFDHLLCRASMALNSIICMSGRCKTGIQGLYSDHICHMLLFRRCLYLPGTRNTMLQSLFWREYIVPRGPTEDTRWMAWAIRWKYRNIWVKSGQHHQPLCWHWKARRSSRGVQGRLHHSSTNVSYVDTC